MQHTVYRPKAHTTNRATWWNSRWMRGGGKTTIKREYCCCLNIFLCCLKSLFSLSNTYPLQISLTPTHLQMCVAKICESVDFKWIGNFAEFFFVRSTLRILYMYIALDFVVVVVGVVRVGSTTRPKLQVKTTNDNEEEKRSPRRNSRAINAAPHFLSFVLHSSQRGNFLYWMMPWTSTNTLITDEEWRTINF